MWRVLIVWGMLARSLLLPLLSCPCLLCLRVGVAAMARPLPRPRPRLPPRRGACRMGVGVLLIPRRGRGMSRRGVPWGTPTGGVPVGAGPPERLCSGGRVVPSATVLRLR